MTDRIRELMNQVGIGRPVGAGDGDTYVVQPVTPAQLRKFAALVRREALEEALDLAEHMHAKNNNLRVIVSDMGSMMVRMVAGIEHLAEIARLWEPDHSSGADRAGWARAQDAKNDAMKLLADLPARITANATQQECTDAIRAAMEADK